MQECDVCGQPMPPQTGRGARRKRHAECSPRRKRRVQPDIVGSAAIGSVSESVRTEVARLDAGGTSEAAAALRLAERIDADAETGAILAALTKELRATMTAIRAAAARAPHQADPVDDLKARRARRAV